LRSLQSASCSCRPPSLREPQSHLFDLLTQCVKNKILADRKTLPYVLKTHGSSVASPREAPAARNEKVRKLFRDFKKTLNPQPNLVMNEALLR
jgi:hypothetical protein